MARGFVAMTARDAVERLRPGMRVMLPPGCGEPRALVAEICRQSERLRDLTLMGGIHLGDYPWARPEHAGLRYATWHMSPHLETATARSRRFLIRTSTSSPVRPGGHWAPDCVLVHTAPPDARLPESGARWWRCRRRARPLVIAR
jgi:hypothetical protein